MKKYRLALMFAVTAMMVIAVAALTVNIVIGDAAEKNLVGIAVENSARDAAHIESLLRSQWVLNVRAVLDD